VPSTSAMETSAVSLFGLTREVINFSCRYFVNKGVQSACNLDQTRR
jgi:hypothetical protein